MRMENLNLSPAEAEDEKFYLSPLGDPSPEATEYGDEKDDEEDDEEDDEDEDDDDEEETPSQ
jgi:hypothetical protein